MRPAFSRQGRNTWRHRLNPESGPPTITPEGSPRSGRSDRATLGCLVALLLALLLLSAWILGGWTLRSGPPRAVVAMLDHLISRPKPPVSPRQKVRGQMAEIETALWGFEMHCGRFPTTAEGLAALVTRPPGAPSDCWKPLLKAIPNDPWGNPYVYACPGVHYPNSYDLYSLGPDGVTGTGGEAPDDIGNLGVPSSHSGN